MNLVTTVAGIQPFDSERDTEVLLHARDCGIYIGYTTRNVRILHKKASELSIRSRGRGRGRGGGSKGQGQGQGAEAEVTGMCHCITPWPLH